MSALEELIETLSRVEQVIEGAKTAEQRAIDAAAYMKTLRVGFDAYGYRTVSPPLVAWADELNEKVRLELLAEIEKRHADDLEARRMKLESLRAIIPSLAAKAAVEIGVTARSLGCNGDVS